VTQIEGPSHQSRPARHGAKDPFRPAEFWSRGRQP
jgi:hypothetical protein